MSTAALDGEDMRSDAGHEPSAAPAVSFDVLAAGHVPFAAAPTMEFSARADAPDDAVIESLSLSVQVMIDPARRGYDTGERERLAELFGPPASWAPSTQGLVWAHVVAVVPRFTQSTMFTLEVPCTYDLEVAATKYFYALREGTIPLSFHISGTIFYRGDGGRPMMSPIPWSTSTTFGLPLNTWKAMIAAHYPGGGWIRLSAGTLAALNERRASRGLTFDHCIQELLDGS